MAYKDYVGWEPEDWLPHIEDELRKDTQMYCSNSFLGARPVTTPTGLQVGDTVRVVGDEYAGQVGEIQVIDFIAADGDYYGVYLDAPETIVFFKADELETVKMTRQEIIERRENEEFRIEVREFPNTTHCIIRKSNGALNCSLVTMRQAINWLLHNAGYEYLARREHF